MKNKDDEGCGCLVIVLCFVLVGGCVMGEAKRSKRESQEVKQNLESFQKDLQSIKKDIEAIKKVHER